MYIILIALSLYYSVLSTTQLANIYCTIKLIYHNSTHCMQYTWL